MDKFQGGREDEQAPMREKELEAARKSMVRIAEKAIKIAEDAVHRQGPAEDMGSRPKAQHRVIQDTRMKDKEPQRVIVSEMTRLKLEKNRLLSEQRRAEEQKKRDRVGPSGIGARTGNFANGKCISILFDICIYDQCLMHRR